MTQPIDHSSSRTDSAKEFLRLASSGNARAAFDRFVTAGFRHHNAYFRGDAESLLTAMDENAKQNPHKGFDILRTIEQNDLVAVHSRVRLKPDGQDNVVVHIFRFDGDRIAELWDVGQGVPPDSPNENGVF